MYRIFFTQECDRKINGVGMPEASLDCNKPVSMNKPTWINTI